MRFSSSLALLACVSTASALVACGPSDFDPASLIESVRILASRSDKPYAKPGATVHAEVLAVDARPDASTNEPMKVYWLPFVCVNPPNDAFYACFSQFESSSVSIEQAGGGDGGSAATITGEISSWDGGVEASVAAGVGMLPSGGSLGSIPTGVDISPYLVQGTRAEFHLPSDIITSHAKPKGTTAYGVAIVFNIACAGHVELIPLDPSNQNPEQVPLGCFDAKGKQLSADDYVLGYTEVFAYDSVTNQNPVIKSFTFHGTAVNLDGGLDAAVAFAHCDASDSNKCPDNIADLEVPDASWERDPQDLGSDGGPLGEQIWVDYYTTMGSLRDDAILLFDPSEGRVMAPKPEDLQDVTQKQRGTLWAVVHDNRGGATWITVPLNAQ